MTYPKPCPICGGTDFDVEYEDTGKGCTAYLICMECDEDVDTRGPVSKPCATEEQAEEEATIAWNKFVAQKAAGS